MDTNRAYAQVIEEADNLSGLTRLYLYGDDLISQSHISGNDVTTAQSDTYLYDGLGSVRTLTDSTGAITDTYTYEAFGGLATHTGTTENRYLFTGEQFDPNVGFYYVRARYYNPSIGRFQTMDTYAGRMHEPQTLHKYLYVHANPVNNIDPSGLASLPEKAAVTSNLSIQANIGARAVSFRGTFAAANDAVYGATAAGISTWARNSAVLGLALSLQSSSSKKDNLGLPPILYTGWSDLPHTGQHISSALAGLGQTIDGSPHAPMPFFLNRSARIRGQWYNQYSPCNTARGGNTCDEYPFASTFQGGPLSYALGGVSLAVVPRSETLPQAHLLARFYSIARRSRFEANPLKSGFIAVAGPGRSFCTDDDGRIYDGCRLSGRR